MTPTQATALATRLAEAVHHPSPTVVAQEWYFRIILPLLQAQAVEDGRHEKMLRFQRTESVQEVERLQIVEEHLRALVGRMKEGLKKSSNLMDRAIEDMEEEIEGLWVKPMREALKEADNCVYAAEKITGGKF